MQGGEVTLESSVWAADAQLTTLGTVVPYIYQPRHWGNAVGQEPGRLGTTASSIRAIVRERDRVSPFACSRWRGMSLVARRVRTIQPRRGTGSVGARFDGRRSAFTGSFRSRSANALGRSAIRMALGATARDVLGTILRQSMRAVVIGAVIGVAAASAVSRILSSVLFGVSPADPVGLGGAALLVLGVALVAGMMAARPATRADPTSTLRYE